MAETRETAQNGSRRWHHLRPTPRRRTDFFGVNSTWWMVLAWLILILAIFFPWW
jgi:hypothetical protein